MSFSIKLKPSPEEIEANYNKYQALESEYPTVPKEKRKRFVLIFTLISFVIFAIPVLILQVCRIPFRLLRKFRIKMLRNKSQKAFDSNNSNDPDNWREYVFEQPALQQTKFEKKVDREKNEFLEKAHTLKEEWYQNPNDINKVMEFTVYQNVANGYKGNKEGLFLLDQLKELPEQPALKYDILYWNLGAILQALQLRNQAKHYQDLAFEKGYTPPKDNAKNKSSYFMAFIGIVFVSWNALYRDIINCWPS